MPEAESRAAGRRLAGLIRLVHPFPSLLNGAATSALALLAGGDLPTAGRLGLAMVALQMSIGALNDVIDAPADAGRKPRKPIPMGVLSVAAGRAVTGITGGVGLLLAVPSGPIVLVIAAAGLATGYGYDLRAKGTAWSWLPFAIGIPLLPVFAWVGATGRLPPAMALLLPAAIAAGTALAIANARADLERDGSAGLASIATRLGLDRGWVVQVALLIPVIVLAVGSLSIGQGPQVALAGTLIAAAVIVAGLALGRRATPGMRQRSWEIQAVGVAGLAAAWLAGLAGPR